MTLLSLDTRAVHTALPPSRAVTASSAPSAVSAAWAMLACSTGGVPIVKITIISLPSSSVTPAVTNIAAGPGLARLASSKSDGRIPRMIFFLT